MTKLIASVLLALSAGVAYAALQPSNTMDGREHIGSTRATGELVAKIHFYTPPVMLYGKPIPPAKEARLPEWYYLETDTNR